MGSWTVLSFDVENLYERMNQLESWLLPSDDTTIDSSGVIELRTDRAYGAYYDDLMDQKMMTKTPTRQKMRS